MHFLFLEDAPANPASPSRRRVGYDNRILKNQFVNTHLTLFFEKTDVKIPINIDFLKIDIVSA